MKIILKILSIVALAAILITSCENKKTEMKTEIAENKLTIKEVIQNNDPEKGKNVPNNLVCMVNDVYMGKEQIEVPFEGKMYYGCCNMCKEKIPKMKVFGMQLTRIR